jgi:hypothetical protein
MDAAIAQQLALLGVLVCESWSPPAYERRQLWGDIVVDEPAAELSAIPSIDDERDRDVFRLWAELIEGRGVADGFAYRELASTVLQRRASREIGFVVSYPRTFEAALGPVWNEAYEAIAERYLC